MNGTLSRRTQASPADRFWEKVEKTDTCWLWTGAILRDGYGQFSALAYGYRTIRAHRFAWELVNGPIPAGLFVLHHCDVRNCVHVSTDPEASHLFLGTQNDNVHDMIAKGRQCYKGGFGERHGRAKLTDDIVRLVLWRLARGDTQRSIALDVGVTHGVIGRIGRHERWKHVVS